MQRHYDHAHDLGRAFDDFGQWVARVFLAIIVPLCTLALGTAGIGAEREDRTLLWLLIRPLPRPLILLAKYMAALPLTIGLVVGSFYVYCTLAGPTGALAWRLFLPAIVGTTVAYLGLFQLFAVLWRHATILALVYALFVEWLVGSLPGIIKRVAVNYYGRNLLYQLGAPEGMQQPDPRQFESLGAEVSIAMLAAIALISVLLAMVIFQHREYRDLA
jgi:ABC-2 type transport system permease protein